MKIWLDDERDPPDDSWTVARDSDAFEIIVSSNLDAISDIAFDHDLGDESRDGSECASYYCCLALFRGHRFARWSVHSMNPDGAKNIASKMASAEKIFSNRA